MPMIGEDKKNVSSADAMMNTFCKVSILCLLINARHKEANDSRVATIRLNNLNPVKEFGNPFAMNKIVGASNNFKGSSNILFNLSKSNSAISIRNRIKIRNAMTIFLK